MVDSFKVTIRPTYAPLIALRDLEISQLYENFKNETKIITEKTVGVMRDPKKDGLGREFENLCKQRRDAKLV